MDEEDDRSIRRNQLPDQPSLLLRSDWGGVGVARGKLRVKVVPVPSWLDTLRVPPWASTMALLMGSPSPVRPAVQNGEGPIRLIVDRKLEALPAGHQTVLGGHNLLWVCGVAPPTFLLLSGESGM